MSAKPLILFHYPLSPFSEKLRAMLGYAGLGWQSLQVREMPPRPLLQRLAGGYRKIPVAQIGADIFCDTRCIASEIARLADRPERALENCGAAAQTLAAHADLQAFLACAAAANGLNLGRKLVRQLPALDVARFLWDRARIGAQARLPADSLGLPLRVLRSHLQELQTRLSERAFLFGEQPNHADFSCYHGLWFLRDQGGSRRVDPYPAVLDWMARMRGFGHGRPRPIAEAQALAQAGASRPRRIPAGARASPWIGRRVQIAPSDYARDRCVGTLVGDAPQRWVLALEDTELGALHLHFPKDGFSLSPTA